MLQQESELTLSEVVNHVQRQGLRFVKTILVTQLARDNNMYTKSDYYKY